MKKIKDREVTPYSTFCAIIMVLGLAAYITFLLISCSKKDIQVPKKQTYFIRVGAINPSDTIYSTIIKVK